MKAEKDQKVSFIRIAISFHYQKSLVLLTLNLFFKWSQLHFLMQQRLILIKSINLFETVQNFSKSIPIDCQSRVNYSHFYSSEGGAVSRPIAAINSTQF